MLRPWDEGTGYLDPTPRDSKERGEAEGCGGPVLRPEASNAVVDHVGVKMARGRLKERRARARPLFLLILKTEREGEGRVVALSREGREGQGLMYPPSPSPTPAPFRLHLKIRLLLFLHALAGFLSPSVCSANVSDLQLWHSLPSSC